MRPTAFSLLFVVVACSGNSLKIGSDESGGGSSERGGTSAAGSSGKGGSPGKGASVTGAVAGVMPVGGTWQGAAGNAYPSGGAAGAGAAPTGGTSTGGSGAMPSITSCTEEVPFVGVWEGSVLNLYFEPMQDLRLVVVANEELGGYEATLTFGTGNLPPPVAGRDEPYPSLEYWPDLFDIDDLATIEPFPGFAYSAVGGAGCDEVFRMSVSVSEPWEEWCSLQTSVYTPGTGWGCTYRGGGAVHGQDCDVQDDAGNVVGSYPLWKCTSCGAFSDGVCACTEASCTFNRETTRTFDLKLATSAGGEVLSGPDPRCGDCTVQLERIE